MSLLLSLLGGSGLFDFTLAATEASDTAAFVLVEGQNLTLAATEAADTAAFELVEGQNLTLAATEASDTADFSLAEGQNLDLAATEESDTASFALEAGVVPPVVEPLAPAGGTANYTIDPGPRRDEEDQEKLRRIYRRLNGTPLELAATEAADTAAFVIAEAPAAVSDPRGTRPGPEAGVDDDEEAMAMIILMLEVA